MQLLHAFVHHPFPFRSFDCPRYWHRPLGRYMDAFLPAGLCLTHFSEPAPQGVTGDKADRHRRVPNFLIMEWHKPG